MEDDTYLFDRTKDFEWIPLTFACQDDINMTAVTIIIII